ncbi:MAG: sulfite exporter TauE/SafE family protein [Acidimicrobiales bacterium]
MTVVGLLFAGVVGVSSVSAGAHPLGNFTSNTYAGLLVVADHVAVDYVLDLAEIPTQQIQSSITTSFESDRCGELAAGLSFEADGAAVAVESNGGRLTMPPGLAGLSTLRLECDLVAGTGPLGNGAEIAFVDNNLEGAVGWREVTAVGDGMRLVGSDVPEESVSGRLTAYPEGRRALDVTSASFTVSPGGAANRSQTTRTAAPSTSLEGDRQTRWLAGLVDDRRLTLGAGTVAVLVAMVLGTLHALAPGHGKTIMAAYIVGRKGRLRHVLGIGATVAVTHTIGVLGLGVLLTTSEAFAGAKVYPVLGAVSGALVVVVGITLLHRLRPASGHHHHHHHPDGHDHHHDHGAHVHGHDGDARVPGWGGLVAMGVAGGLVPAPSAVLVLLGALALGRAWFGILLVLAYGTGMAMTLLGAGIVLNRIRDWIEPRLVGLSARPLPRLLPMGSALAVIGGGLLLAIRALISV